MAEQIFVGREGELARLQGWLDKALAGQTQVGFLAGEAGAGKTTLMHEFTRRAEEAHPDLVVALGNCNAQTGLGDPYLPWREVLAQLTGDVEARKSEQAAGVKNADRLKDLLRVSGSTLMEFGPDLIGTLIPGGALVARVATYAAGQAGLNEML